MAAVDVNWVLQEVQALRKTDVVFVGHEETFTLGEITQLVEAAAKVTQERLQAAFLSRFQGAGEQFFDYLHGEEAAQECALSYWQEVLDRQE